jgi:hypothetical protein
MVDTEWPVEILKDFACGLLREKDGHANPTHSHGLLVAKDRPYTWLVCILVANMTLSFGDHFSHTSMKLDTVTGVVAIQAKNSVISGILKDILNGTVKVHSFGGIHFSAAHMAGNDLMRGGVAAHTAVRHCKNLLTVY